MIAPKLSASSQEKLRGLGWSWVTDAGQMYLQFADQIVTYPPPGTGSVRSAGAAKPASVRGIGVFAVTRRLLVSAPASQVELASTTGLSQPRVSQILNALVKDGLVEREDRRWRTVDWDAGLHLWLQNYPGPGGVTTYWTGLDDAWPQMLTALRALPDDTVASGDQGADLLASWRQPRRAVVYVRTLRDLGPTGLVQVGGTSAATLSVCAPADQSVWPTEPIRRTFGNHEILVADPLQVLWDIQADASEDSSQAAERLTQWLKQRVQAMSY